MNPWWWSADTEDDDQWLSEFGGEDIRALVRERNRLLAAPPPLDEPDDPEWPYSFIVNRREYEALMKRASAFDGPSVAAPIVCGEPTPEAICNADCTSGCHAAECEHHGVKATFYCILCGTPLLEERRFCAAHEPTPPPPLDGLREALSTIREICKPMSMTMTGPKWFEGGTPAGGGSRERIWRICNAALRDEGETP